MSGLKSCYRSLQISLGTTGAILGMTLIGMGIVLSKGSLGILLLVGGSTGTLTSGLTLASAYREPWTEEQITRFREQNQALRQGVEDQQKLIAALRHTEIVHQEQIERLTTEADKLRRLYRQTHALVITLTDTSSDLGILRAEFEETQEGYESALAELKRLTESLSRSRFQELDRNRDNLIDQSEFDQWTGENSGQ